MGQVEIENNPKEYTFQVHKQLVFEDNFEDNRNEWIADTVDKARETKDTIINGNYRFQTFANSNEIKASAPNKSEVIPFRQLIDTFLI